MITLCMTGLPAAELDNIVARQLAAFGRAVDIKTFAPVVRGEYGAIVATMSTLAEANELASELGDAQFGPTVVVKLFLVHMTRTRTARGLSK